MREGARCKKQSRKKQIVRENDKGEMKGGEEAEGRKDKKKMRRKQKKVKDI